MERGFYFKRDEIAIRRNPLKNPANPPFEVVEKKGAGHPDSICDSLADAISRALSKFYLNHYGRILHHNVDKVLLSGGCSQPEFGGGKIVEPIRIFLAGRATDEIRGERFSVPEIAIAASQEWLARQFPNISMSNFQFECLIRRGSSELVELFLRLGEDAVPLANDSSIGAGYAPLSATESMVLAIDGLMQAEYQSGTRPEAGCDTKILAVASIDSISATVACAFIDKYLRDKNEYWKKKAHLAAVLQAKAIQSSEKVVHLELNAADNPETDSMYLTVSGTSAESGDDGQTGRGNRVNGLITPFHPISLESSAGKNPVSHTGKIYQAVSGRIAATLVNEISEWEEVECVLVSKIGSPITKPQFIGLQVSTPVEDLSQSVQNQVEAIVRAELSDLKNWWRSFLTDGHDCRSAVWK